MRYRNTYQGICSTSFGTYLISYVTQVISSTIGIEVNANCEKNENGQEVVDMCKAWDDHWNSGKEITEKSIFRRYCRNIGGER